MGAVLRGRVGWGRGEAWHARSAGLCVGWGRDEQRGWGSPSAARGGSAMRARERAFQVCVRSVRVGGVRQSCGARACPEVVRLRVRAAVVVRGLLIVFFREQVPDELAGPDLCSCLLSACWIHYPRAAGNSKRKPQTHARAW